LEPLDFDEVLYGGDAIEGDHYVVIFSPTASIVLKWLQFKFLMHHNKGFTLVRFQDISITSTELGMMTVLIARLPYGIICRKVRSGKKVSSQ
jgi:hypothetical protein